MSAFSWRLNFPGAFCGIVLRILSNKSPSVSPFQFARNAPPVNGGADSPPCFRTNGFGFNPIAGVQVIKQAAEAAKSLDPTKVAEKMHSSMKFKTVLGDLSFDKKGDITKLDYVMYIWKKDASGKVTYVECPGSDCSKMK